MITRVEAGDEARFHALAELHAATFEPLSRGWSADEFATLAARGVLLAADMNDGFALATIAADEAELVTIAVAQARRRGGLGARLLDEVIAAAHQQGAVTMHLEVAADNAAAIALYERAGFTVAGRRKAYYPRPGGPSGPVDALVMSCALGR